jgi:YesN/AraC family two-component response regulator
MSQPGPYTVVLVDDAHDLRRLWRLMLDRDSRFTVAAEAANGRAGVAAVGQHQPDLVLLDVEMPVMDGLEALPLIRELSPRSTVVMLSALSLGSAQMLRASALGAHDYLVKGLSRRELLSRLAALCQRLHLP